MTYLEEYCRDYNCTETAFWNEQEDLDGFCPRDVGLDECIHVELSCKECWNRKIEEES